MRKKVNPISWRLWIWKISGRRSRRTSMPADVSQVWGFTVWIVASHPVHSGYNSSPTTPLYLVALVPYSLKSKTRTRKWTNRQKKINRLFINRTLVIISCWWWKFRVVLSWIKISSRSIRYFVCSTTCVGQKLRNLFWYNCLEFILHYLYYIIYIILFISYYLYHIIYIILFISYYLYHIIYIILFISYYLYYIIYIILFILYYLYYIFTEFYPQYREGVNRPTCMINDRWSILSQLSARPSEFPRG